MKKKITQAVILCGGKGVRLGDLTKETPKVLVPIGGPASKPVLDYIIENLARDGITNIILCCGHLLGPMMKYWGEELPFWVCQNIKVRVSSEDRPLGTAGAVENVRELLDDDFLVVYGDVMIDFNIKKLIKTHMSTRPIATLTVWKSDYMSDPHTHLVQTDANGKVVEFVGKRDPNRIYQNQCNAAVYAMSKQIFDYIDYTEFTDRPQDFSNDVFPLILEQSGHLHTYSLERGGYIKDMGTPERLAEVAEYIKNQRT